LSGNIETSSTASSLPVVGPRPPLSSRIGLAWPRPRIPIAAASSTPGDVARLLPTLDVSRSLGPRRLYAFSGHFHAELGAAIPAARPVQFLRRALGRLRRFIVAGAIGSPLAALPRRGHRHSRILRRAFPRAQWNLTVLDTCDRGLSLSRDSRILRSAMAWNSLGQRRAIIYALSRPALPDSLMACFLLGGPAHRAASRPPLLSCCPQDGTIVAIMLGLQGVIYTVDGWDGVIYSAKRYAIRAANPARHFRQRFSIMVFTCGISWRFTSCP